MRPLHVRLRAFGPFPGAEEVDLAALGPLGLFVIAGPTGSGKTTIFDAMSYALYGAVPGLRDPNEMRSHHAAADATPEVELDFEVGGCLYRARRSPGHQRAKLRGTGMVDVAPSAALFRFDGAAWQPACEPKPRIVTEMCTELVGLTAAQFHRVVLLPQGQFEAFLVAKGDERRPLLRHLFGSGLYERAVEHLRREAADATARAEQAAAKVEWATERVAEQLAAAEAAAGLSSGERSSEARLVAVDDAITSLAGALSAAEREAQRASEAATAAAEGARRWALHNERRGRLQALESMRPERDAERTRIELATKAQVVLHAAAANDEAQRRLRESTAALEEHHGTLAAVLAVLGRGELDDPRRLREALAADAAAAAALLRDHERLAELAAELASARSAEIEIGRVVAEAEGELEVTEASVVGHRAEVLQLDPLADQVDDARAAVEAAQRELLQRHELDGRIAALRSLDDVVASADERYRAATAAFLSNAAPRLAAHLVPGEPCAVCGSPEHPAPAQPALDFTVVSPDELDALRDTAAEARRARDEQMVAVRSLTEVLGSVASEEVSSVEHRVETARTHLMRCEDAARRRTTVAAAMVELEATVGALRSRLIALHTDLARAAERCRHAEKDHEEKLGEIDRGTELERQPSVWARSIAAAQAGLDRSDDLRAAVERASVASDLGAQALHDAVRSAGFASADAARAAALPPAALEALAERVERWDREVVELGAQIAADADMVPEGEPPHAQLRVAAQELATQRDALRSRLAEVRAHAESARAAVDALSAQAADLGAIVAEAELAATIAARCAGHLAPRIPLENWVLGSELERVAAAANVHLAAMTAGRYQLLRTDEVLDGRTGAGLDLVVADGHTGTMRRTTSLSGGERFQASLALALGLADVVTSGTAATARTLDVLFVDEGFGSLDPCALDQAIDALDRLRRHGRQVGIITHVEAMKAALPVAVEVQRLPGDRGSTIRQLIA